VDERLSEHELCPDDLLAGQEEAFARDVERLRARSDEFVEVSCPACGQAAGPTTLEKWGFEYVSCERCRTLFMSPRPSPEVMASYYANSENYAYWAEHIFPASEDSRREKINRPWLERIRGYCEENNVALGTMVEIGPGFGTFAALAGEAFERVVAVEPTPEMAQSCRERGVEVIEKSVEDITDEVTDADVVCAFEVAEHLFEPRAFVEVCGRLLRPGGLLVVSCPNGLGFDIAALGAVSWAIDPEHVNLFNPDSISLLLDDTGFEVVSVTTPGRLDAEFVHDAIGRGEFDAPADPFLRRVLVDEWDRLGWPFQQFLAENGLSSHMWTVGRKR
jgi:SAM-dependent methyltransferase